MPDCDSLSDGRTKSGKDASWLSGYVGETEDLFNILLVFEVHRALRQSLIAPIRYILRMFLEALDNVA